MLDCPGCGKIKKNAKPGKYICSSCGTKFIIRKNKKTSIYVKKIPICVISIVSINIIIFIVGLFINDELIFNFSTLPWDGFQLRYLNSDLKVVTLDLAPPGLTILYRSFTYGFIHRDFIHLLYNMIGLGFLGTYIEDKLGKSRFLIFIALLNYFTGLSISVLSSAPTIGASGIVFGLLLSFAWFYPHQEIYIRFAYIPSQYILIIYTLIEIGALIIYQEKNGISHTGHLFGLLYSLILLIILYWPERKLFKKRAIYKDKR